MAGPPRMPKPPFSASLVLQASQELTWSQKGLWLRIWALDRDQRGCYASAESLAEDLGMGARNVEKLRAQLVAVGLLANDLRRGRDGAAWFALLPSLAIPKHDRPSREERRQHVEALDGAIRVARADAETRPAIPNPRSGKARRHATQKTPNTSSVIEEGENPNARSGFDHPQTPNGGSGFGAGRNPNGGTPIPNGRPGLNEEIPNQRSPEVITTLPEKISVSGEIINPPTSSARCAREVGAVADGQTTRAPASPEHVGTIVARVGIA